MYNYFSNDSDNNIDKSRKRETDGILNVDSSEATNSINYGLSLNYGSNTKNNYLSGINKKKYPWDIQSTLEQFYPIDNKKQNKVDKKIMLKYLCFLSKEFLCNIWIVGKKRMIIAIK